MKQFLAVYIGTADATTKAAGAGRLTPENEQAGMAAWGQWMNDHADAIVDQGAPLGKTMKANSEGVSAHTNSLTGYVIVRAETLEAAAKLFENHPHFSIFPGDSVEIVECLSMPGT